MAIVYVMGIGGLGNSLCQVAAATYYCKKYGYELCLININPLIQGTKHTISIQNNKKIPKITYKDSIFKNIMWTGTNNMINYISVHNDYTNNKICTNKNILIKGYNQNHFLWESDFSLMKQYLCLDDISINNYIKNKYGIIDNNSICICIRKAPDHPCAIFDKEYYMKSINYLKTKNPNINKLYIVSDVFDVWTHENDFTIIQVKEDDIVQLYFGIMCHNIVLTYSTYHLWFAYLNNNTNPTVIYDNKSDLCIDKNLILDNWININDI